MLRFFVSISTNIKWRKVRARGKGRRVSARLRAEYENKYYPFFDPLSGQRKTISRKIISQPSHSFLTSGDFDLISQIFDLVEI